MTKEELKKDAEENTNKLLEDWELYDPEALQEAYLAGAEPREKRIAELEEQIEKMKCCYNCKHSRTDYEHCITNKHEKWEMIEK